MRKIIIILITLLFLSCREEEKKAVVEFKDIKNIVQNSREVGDIFESPLTDKTVVTITYPDYLIESYQLLKFVSGLMSRDYLLTIYDPQLPQDSYPEDMLKKLREEAPLLAFEEYIDFYSYLNSREITLSLTPEVNEGILLHLNPESLRVEPKTLYENSIDIIFAGTESSLEIRDLIEELPEEKKISALTIESSPYSEVLGDYDLLVLMDNFDSYRAVTPLKNIYNEENYNNAPEVFKQETKSIITSYQINRMNNYLSRLILNNMRRYEN